MRKAFKALELALIGIIIALGVILYQTLENGRKAEAIHQVRLDHQELLFSADKIIEAKMIEVGNIHDENIEEALWRGDYEGAKALMEDKTDSLMKLMRDQAELHRLNADMAEKLANEYIE